MSYQEIYKEVQIKMQKSLGIVIEELKSIRAGGASPALVENIKVDYYGSLTPLKQIATITVPDSKLIMIKPYDYSILGAIEKAILKSELGITPINDGKIIRLMVPPLSEERRKQLVKRVKEIAEHYKVSIRNIRRDANKQAEIEEKAKTMSEDEKFRLKDEIQKLTEKFEHEINELVEKKTREIMEV